MDDTTLFRSKSPNITPRGQDQSAVDAVPSDQSGTNVRIGTPVWQKFVTNTVAQENNRAAVQAENEQIRQARIDNRQLARPGVGTPLFKGAKGKLIRVQGGRGEELNPEEWADDPEVGPIARKSLWEREIETHRKDSNDSAFRLRDPAFHARGRSDKEIQDMQAQALSYPTADPEHQKIQAQIDDDAAYRKEKAELGQRAYDSEARARQIEGTDPESWWQSRSQPSPEDTRAAAVAETQAKRAEVQAADNSAIERRAQINAKLEQGVTGTESVALKAELSKLDEGQAIIAHEAAKAEEPVKAAQADAQNAKDKDFFRLGDTISGIWDAVKGLGTSAPAAFYQLVEGMERPDQYSDSAKQAFAEADAFNKEMQAKTAANQAAGTSSSVGETFREAGGSLGFSLGSMAAAIPASMAGAKAGAAAGGAIGAAVGAPAAGAGAAPGAAIGASIGGTIGGVSAGMAASGAAAYRMAGASFLNESWQQIQAESQRKNGRPMNEEEMASAYAALIPIAQNTALWEAGPEAVGNAVTMGAGKIIFGLGKPLAAKFAKTVGGKAVAAAGSLATELAGETVTNVEQSADQQKAQAIAQGQDPNTIQADWSAGGVVESFKEVAPQTLALMGLMGGAGGVLKLASKATGIGGTESPTESVPASELTTEQLIPEINTALTAIDPEIEPATPEEIAAARIIANPSDGAQGIAESVLIERELGQVEIEDDQAMDDSDADFINAQTTGDKVAIASAEANVEKARASAGRADVTRAVLKIAGGQQLDDLTSAELASIGFKDSGESFAPMTAKELKDAGITAPLIRQGADGSIIITDGALKKVGQISTRARGRVKMTEAEAIQKAKQLASQPVSTSQDGTQRDSAAGSPPSGGVSPDETNAAVEFDVPTRSGRVIRVQAATAAEAEQEAAAQSEMGDSILVGQAKPVLPPPTNEPARATAGSPQEATQGNGAPDAPTDQGSTQPGGAGVSGQAPVADNEADIPEFIRNTPKTPHSPGVAPGKTAIAAAKKRLAKIAKQSPDIAAALTSGSPEATETRISIDPEATIADAVSHGMSDKEALARFNAVLDEEIKHFSQLRAARQKFESIGSPGGDFKAWREAYYGDRWQTEFVDTKKADIARTLYAKGNAATEARWDAMPDSDKFMEATRMMMQRRDGTVTEQTKLWANISKALAEDLRAMLRALRAMVKGIDLTPALKADIEFFENELRNVLKQSQPRAGNSKTGGEKPASSKPGDGTGGAAEGERPGSAAVDGGTEQAPSAGVGSPLAVGAKVEFERDGKRLTGLVALVKNGFARVRPDFDPTISFAIKEDALTVLAAPADLKGERIDKEWVSYSEESHSLGIPRAEMPQIKSDDRSAMVQFLKARGIDYVEEEVLPDSLKPTQLEYSPAKVKKAREYTGGNRALLISDDGHLVDGHHQWMAALDEPTTPVRVIRLMAPIREILSTVAEMPSVETAGGSTATPDVQSDQNQGENTTAVAPIVTPADVPADSSGDVQSGQSSPEVVTKGQWTPEVQKQYRKLKNALNKAIKAKDWPKVIEEADRGSAYFEDNAYPDDWSAWERAKEDAEREIARAPKLSEADKALLDAMEGLFAAALPESFTKPVPPDRIGPLVTVATKYLAEGVSTPEALAERLGALAEGRMRQFSQSIWFAFKMAGTPGAAEPDWADVYGRLDNPASEADGAVDDTTPQSDSGGQGPEASSGLEPGVGGPMDSKPSGEDAGAGAPQQLSDDGSGVGKGGNPASVRGNASRPGGRSQTGEQGAPGADSKRGGKRSPQGTDSVNTGDGNRVAGGEQPTHSPGRTGYRLTDPERIIGTGGPKARFSRNKLALETFDTVLSEQRDPTPEEQDILAAYIGWGSFGQELFQGSWDRPNPKPEWQEESDWLRDHLGKDGWESIRDSIINAHYTDPPHVQALWRIAQHLGFKGGRVLEPSMGIGSFFGLMPDVLRAKSSLTGIELDRVVGSMAQMLYPDANIRIMGYEKSATADGFYDLVIGNWPFAKDGPSDPRYNSLGLSLHDYFFVKALDQVRPGGLVIGITSSGTMDKKGQTARRQMARRAELVGAFRFPSGAFEKYAGTKVVTDVVILKKRSEAASGVESDGWINTEEFGTGDQKFNANEYWLKHPDHVLGEMTFGHGTTQGRAGMIVNRPSNYAEILATVENALPKDILTDSPAAAEKKSFQNRESGADQNSVTWNDGDTTTPTGFYVVRGEQLEPLEQVFTWRLKDETKTEKRRDELKKLLGLRQSVHELLAAQRDGDPKTEDIRKTAKDRYDSLVKAHGPIGKSFMVKAMTRAGDPMALTLENLERFENGKYVPREILLKDIMRRPVTDAKGSIEDAYAIQRNQSTALDVDSIAEISGSTVAEVVDRLVGLDQIFKTPSGVWESREEYLGGNVRRKLREAKDAKSQGLDMDRNIAALEVIQPKDVAYFEIEVQMGASWIPRENYLEFASHLLGGDPSNAASDFELTKASSGWNFKVANKSLAGGTNANATWGTALISFSKIFQAAMNGTTVKIYDTTETKAKVINEQETELANKKIDDIREELTNWLWSDPERTGKLASDYNEVMNSEVVPQRSGSHLRFEGLALTLGSSEFDFRQHQKDAVWRFIMDGRGVGAHEVGTGKTFTMAGLAVEGRRLGKFRKSLVFAHNANSESVFRDFQAAYPGGKFLYIDNLSPENRDNAMRQIATDEWDAIVVPHSLIDRFALREETLMEIANKQIIQMESEIADALDELGVGSVDINDEEDVAKKLGRVKDSHTAKELVKARNRIIKRIKDKAAKGHKDNAVFFEDLGVDSIMVDEAHMFKKIALATRKEVKGLNKTESERGWMLGALTDTIKARNNGKGVFLFTGTPLTNNLNEAYNMMRFVMDDAMSDVGIDGFDDWFNAFAASVTDVELTTGGTFEPVSRLLSFINVPELARLAGRYFDVVLAKNMPEFVPRDTEDGKSPNAIGRPFKKVRPVTAEMSPEQKAHKADIQSRYEWFQRLKGRDKRKAMLQGVNTPIQLETEGIKAALDMRMVNHSAEDYQDSKVNMMIRNAVDHYIEDPASTQMIFMEQGWNDFTDAQVAVRDGNGIPLRTDEGKKVTRKERRRQFNLVRDMVEKLVAKGVRPEEIAVFSNMSLDPIADRPGDVLRRVNRVTGKITKEDLAAQMREGKIRFAIGSTQTMGTGVNAQNKMRAMHHLDAPWTPGEFEQRNGRGHRQGNEWNTVFEYRYFTEGSHDGRRWQVLLNKVKFISRFTEMLIDAGGSDLRVLAGDGADLGEEGSNVSDFEQSFSTAAGDPRILVRAKLRTDVDKLERKRDAHFQSIARAKGDIRSLLGRKDREGKIIAETEEVVAAVAAAREKPFEVTIDGQTFAERKDAEDHLAAYPSLTQKDDGKAVMDFHGIKVVHDWNPMRSAGDQSGFYALVPIKGGKPVKLRIGKLSIASLEGSLRGQTRSLANMKENYETIDASVASLEEMIRKPFTREPELEAKTNALQQIEVELNRAPQPAPSWLRNGAPVGSLVYLADGKAYDVAAHRWDENGWWVLVEDGTGMRPIDYRKALDDSGHPMFDDVPFVAPDSTQAEEEQAATDGLKASPLPRLRADSPEWKAMSTEQRREYLKTGLRASPLPETANNIGTFKKRIRINKPLADEARAQQAAFGNISTPRLANPGGSDQRSRDEQDIVDALYEHERQVRKDRDVFAEAKRRMTEDPAGVEEKLVQIAAGKTFATDDSDHLAFAMLINRRSTEAGNDLAKHEENMRLRMSYRALRADTARELRIGYDQFMTPEERSRASIADAIYTPTLAIEKRARDKNWSPEKRREFIRQASSERLKNIEAALKKMGVTLDEITSGQAYLSLSQNAILKQSLALRSAEEQMVVKLIQKKHPVARIRRATGMAEDRIEGIRKALYDELLEKAREKARAGLKLENFRDAMKGLQAAPLLNAAALLTDEQIEAEARRIVEIGFGIPAELTRVALPKPKAPRFKPVDSDPHTADWSRPVFTDGLNTYTFDTKDRSEIMNRVEAIRGIASATGKINTLTGKPRAKAEELLQQIDTILAKYGTDARGIFASAKPVDDYRFNIHDRAHVAAIARAIQAIDADVVDKALEWTYASILSGLQTMAVNAMAAVPAAWDMTVGRGFEMAVNAMFRDTMSATLGEEKYILRAAAPALARAASNAAATWGSELPMFDEDFLGNAADLDKLFDGKAPKIGVIGGTKGRIIRIPMRILLATDEYNRTAIAAMEVGAMAFRVGMAKSKKKGDPLFGKVPGTPEFDRFLKVQVNTPGSFAAKLAAQKASRLIFSNALPGQKDPVTGEKVPIEGVGDVIGAGAALLNKFATQDTDNLFAKAALAALRVSFFPFQRTPFNLIRRGVRHTLNPVSLVDIGLLIGQNSIVRGADGKYRWKWNARERNPEIVSRISQQLQGAVLLALLAGTAAGEGDEDDLDKPLLITGSQPFTLKGMAERAAQMRSGLGPYRISFRRRDGSERFGFNYGRLEPLATTLAATIDTIKGVKRTIRAGGDAGEAASAALGGLAAQSQDKTYMQGFADLFSLLNNAMESNDDLKNNRKFQQFLASRVAMMIPNIIKQPIRETDSQFRDRSEGFMQELLYQAWPYGQKVAKVDPYGQVSEKTGTAAGRIIDVTDAGTDTVNPTDAMLIRWRDKHPDQAWFPSAITSGDFKHPVTGKSVKMNATQLAEFREMSGKRLTALLKREVVNSANPSMMDVEKVKKAVTQARSDAKKILAYKFARQ